MSAAEDRDPAPGGQDDPVGAAGARALLAGACGGVDHDLGPGGGPAAGTAGVAEAGVPGTLQAAVGALQEEEGEQEAAPAGAQEGGSAEEDSDIGPVEEEDQDLERNRDVVVNAPHFPMVGFPFMFEGLAHSLLYRIHHNHHVLTRPWRGGLRRRHPEDLGEEPPTLRARSDREEPPSLSQSEDPGEGRASWEAEVQAGENASAREPKELTEETACPEEVNKYQYENSNQEAQKAGGEEEKGAEDEKEKKNEEQEGPETDLDIAEGSPRKPSWDE